MNTRSKAQRCPSCRAAELVPVTRERAFHPHGETVVVSLQTLRCPSCGAERTSSQQHDANLVVLRSRKAHYGELLLGEEISRLRRRYGITQQQAAKIFGKGKIAFSRYENETSYPDESTTKLLTLAIEKPDVMKWLADKAGVELPLWAARCEDERKAKERVGQADPAARRWAQQALSESRAPVSAIATDVGALLKSWTTGIPEIGMNDGRFGRQELAFA